MNNLHTLQARRGGPTVERGAVLNHKEAKARALAVLAGGDPLTASRDAFNALADRNRELLDEGGDAIREALADQVALLEGVVAGFAFQAARAKRPDDARQLAGVAIRASATLVQVLGALHRVTEDRRNGSAIDAS
jgi:hypothetical protein